MSFFAVFNSDRAPIDSEKIQAQHDEVPRTLKLLGPAGQTALMWADPATDLEDKDVRHPVELDERFWLLRSALMSVMASVDFALV